MKATPCASRYMKSNNFVPRVLSGAGGSADKALGTRLEVKLLAHEFQVDECLVDTV